AAADQRVAQPFSQLLDTMELGMERAAGRQVGELTPVERLIAMGDRVQNAAYKLRDIERMEPPAREESVELAREILRRLRVQFSDRPVEEFIGATRPEDKAAFAQQAAEFAELYRNLIAEVAQTNPRVMEDPRIKQASDAIGQMVHIIKLMAAKEIPNSVA